MEEPEGSQMDEGAIVAMYKRCKEVEIICRELDRDTMTFEPALMRSVESNQVKVMVKITNTVTQEEIVLNDSDFASAASILSDEKFKLQMAFENGDEYTVSPGHDPLLIMYDNNCFHLGSAVLYPEYLLYNLDTDKSDARAPLKRSVSPYDAIGFLDVKWTILAGEEAEPGEGQIMDIDDASELIGKPWTGMLEIVRAVDLPVMVDQAYVQYEFFGADGKETFTSENVLDITHSPKWEYKRVHHIPIVTQEFIDYLSTQWHIHIYVSPCLKVNCEPISTENPRVREAFGYGEAGIAGSIAASSDPARTTSSTAGATGPVRPRQSTTGLQARVRQLEKENSELRVEVERLRRLLEDHGISAAESEPQAPSSVRSKLKHAQETAAALAHEGEQREAPEGAGDLAIEENSQAAHTDIANAPGEGQEEDSTQEGESKNNEGTANPNGE